MLVEDIRTQGILMKSIEIRKKFFDFFKKHGHEPVPSSSLIPAQDPTLLFANAGMNQFKDIFLGKETRSYKRAVTIQKCVRAGGKHNDLDNVGFTKRHLTFFEMMGNFSFGDYFKKEAIQFAWSFLTQEMNLPVEKMHATVFETDDESYAIWRDSIKLPTDRIHRLGKEHNFWQMGETGPCGPCTEIYIDRGQEHGGTHLTDPDASERYLEIWNLVFMQYDRQPDGEDRPLKQTGVDTGMGLERLCVIMQNKDSVFETDLFTNLIKKIEELTGLKYAQQDFPIKAAFHVLVDHIRSSSFIIADGGAPSNEGRGYVLRKIIRRAALFAQKLTDKNIFPELSRTLVADMGSIYPELKEQAHLIYEILNSEIEKFATNLLRGQHLLNKYFEHHKETNVVSGEQAFKLYDTFGFPIELIHLMAQEHGFTVDQLNFDQHMSKQREQSGDKDKEVIHIDLDPSITTQFTGYDELETDATIIALVVGNTTVESVESGNVCWVIVDRSPFFIVGGGQVPDHGWLVFDAKHKVPLEEVRYINNAIAAKIKAPIPLKIGSPVTSIVNKELRINAMKNHTATHLLQAALIQLFGKQIKQSGSLVHPDYLRFDFTYHENLSSDDIKRVEQLVNEKIRENIPVNVEHATLKEATTRGVIAFFGDKYNPEKVRIVNVPNFSAELCGGTHVSATGDIGTFKITEVTALSAGHRRIVAVTGPRAIELFHDTFDVVKTLSQQFKVKRDAVIAAVEKQQATLKEAQSEIKKLKQQLIGSQLETWLHSIEMIDDIPFLFLHIPQSSSQELREIANLLGQKKEAFYFLASTDGNRYQFYAQVTPQVGHRVNLKNFGVWAKDALGLQGGGTPTSLQGGGAKFDPGFEDKIKEWIKASL